MRSSAFKLGVAKISRRSLADDVREALTDAILTGRFANGDRVVEEEIAKEFDVSRGPVRDAFRQLAYQGLLVLIPHRGARVATLTERDAHEVYSLMAITERLACRLVKGRLTVEALTELKDAVEKMRQAARQKDLLGVARGDLQFTDALFSHAGHRRLQALWQGLKFQSYLLVRTYAHRVYPSLPAIVAHHEKLVGLLENASREQFEEYLMEHAEQIEVRLLNLLGADASQEANSSARAD